MGYKEEKLHISRLEDQKREIDEAVSAIRAKYKRKIANSAKKIESCKCQHHFHTKYSYNDDDGYGIWRTVNVKQCLICKAETVYDKWPLKEK